MSPGRTCKLVSAGFTPDYQRGRPAGAVGRRGLRTGSAGRRGGGAGGRLAGARIPAYGVDRWWPRPAGRGSQVGDHAVAGPAPSFRWIRGLWLRAGCGSAYRPGLRWIGRKSALFVAWLGCGAWLAGCGCLQAEHARPEVAERVGEEPGDVHLGDAQLPGDLGLGHVTAEAQQQDLLLAGGQLAPVRGNGPEVEHVFQLPVLRPQ